MMVLPFSYGSQDTPMRGSKFLVVGLLLKKFLTETATGEVVVKAEVASAFVVVKAQLAFELFVVELDHPAQPREARELLWYGVGRQVADPVVAGLLVAFGPFD